MSQLREIKLGLDELEAIRLADLQGLNQSDVSDRMGISRATVGRILERGRRKIADALIHGKALKLEGGPITSPEMNQTDEEAHPHPPQSTCMCQNCRQNHQERKLPCPD
jgi:hypothetical protein